ncbi:PAS domain-containing protein [Sphingomonas sp.]|uniref:PAS domain-containing hybrid sensor histidine kinase/response regulator n=1 Tax=Sphingomonas sp. TaxID=28214 RepID=UPI001DD9C754|nr:PAS domain-containing protein [Sphingomonas sp.]MBX9795783.1 PAS domain S-box protein [Sphingomonas sp.]
MLYAPTDLTSLLFDQHPDPMAIYDRDSLKFIAVNNAAITSYGYSRDEFLEMKVTDIRVERGATVSSDASAPFPMSESESFYAKHRLKDGRIVDSYVRSHTIEMGGKRYRVSVVRDATQELRAEREAKRLARIGEMAARMARLGHWTVKPCGDIQWSKEAANTFGFTPDTEPDLEAGFRRVPEPYNARIRQVFYDCLTLGKPFDTVCQLDTNAHGRIWVRVMGEVERDEAGNIIHCIGATQDVTELFVAREESARRSEQLLSVLNSVDDPFCILDDEWRLTYFNEAARRALDRPAADLANQTFWDICPFPEESPTTQAVRQAMRDRVSYSTAIHHDKLDQWFHLNLYPTPQGMVLYFTNITEQRAREGQMRMLLAAVDSANDFVLILSPEVDPQLKGRVILYANDTFLRATGFGSDEVIGKLAARFFGNQNPPAIGAEIVNQTRAGQKFCADIWMKTKSGEEILVEADASPLRDADGALTQWLVIQRPVSEKRAREEQMRMLLAAVDSANDFVFILTKHSNPPLDDRRVLYTNQTFLNASGFTREEVIGKEASELTGTRNDPALIDRIREASLNGGTVRTDLWMRTKHGAEILVEGDASPLRDANGEITHWLVIHRPVSAEREQAEQMRMLLAAVDNANDFVFIMSKDQDAESGGRKVIYANQTYLRQSGFSRDEVIGHNSSVLYGQRNDPAIIAKMRTAADRGEHVQADLWMRTKHGDDILVDGNASPLSDANGDITHWLIIQRPVTEQRRAEALMRLNNERARLISQATSGVIWDYDVATGKLWWNENLKTLLGFDPKSFGEELERWTTQIVPEDRVRVSNSFHAAIHGSDSVWRSEYRFTRADGSVATIMDRGFVIRNETGEAVRVIGSMVDITERRELDEQLRQAQKLEAVGQLTGGLAHDFNNLLTVILGNAEAMTAIASDDPDLGILAKMTMSAAERGAELTNRLLSFGRRQKLLPRSINCCDLIQGMGHLLRRTLSERVQIELQLAGDTWPALADPGQLEVALLNLALNARDAMPTGGRLVIETANISHDSGLEQAADGTDPGDYVAISVADSGSGMSREIAQRAFDPFFTTKEVGKGTGLGLSMVYGFAKQSGGTVTIDSALGRGTTVTIYLPRAKRQPPAPRKTSSTVMPSGVESVLVVEDDPLVRSHVCTLLRGLGYSVTTAADGREAMTMIETDHPIDLLFTDIVMPGGVDGTALAAMALKLRPELKLLFTSGYADQRKLPGDGADGAPRILRKPYRRAELAEQVRAALDTTGLVSC